VCETFGKPDDCYELTLLREYRDGYLMSQPDGAEVIRQYYDLAPSIVKHINQRADRKEIYRGVWETYLRPCIQMIEQSRPQQCKEQYIKMVQDLEKQYFLRQS
ncbi:MAG: CFI-box-CTERM domain-containing protein, partial [Oscillospiraceae bacterium]|nr:CFI-box-CTERM domain-containing protein [Oscillospiraceae bacterium]